MARELTDVRAGSTGGTGPGFGDDYRERIARVRLPESVVEHVEAYERVVDERDRFVWKWVYNLFDEFTLPSVPGDALGTVEETKLLLTLFVTTVDDVAEKEGDRETLARARRLPFGDAPRSGADAADAPGREDLLAFLADVWAAVERRLGSAPRGDAYRDLFEFDLRQVFDAVEYSRLVAETPELATLGEATRYGAHNMVLFPYACTDLMFSPAVPRGDLGPLRALLWELQRMARVGNWLSTWERELGEGDPSSGVVVRAIQRGVVAPEEVAAGPADAESLRRRIHDRDVPAELFGEWADARRAALARARRVTAFDATELVEGMETVFSHHLASTGLK